MDWGAVAGDATHARSMRGCGASCAMRLSFFFCLLLPLRRFPALAVDDVETPIMGKCHAGSRRRDKEGVDAARACAPRHASPLTSRPDIGP